MNKRLFFQLCRFGIIGLSAAAVNFSIVVLLVEFARFTPLQANVIAFMIAFQVSYSGHRYWTFRGTTTQHRVALPRLLLLSISNFIVNEGLFYCFLTFFHLPYPLALFCVLAVLPIITFMINKFWVFSSH